MIAHAARLLTSLLIFVLPLFAGAQANFSVDTTSGCAPLLVNFTSTAPGASSYYWDFGDNTNSTLPNPGKIYSQPGSYTVSFTATFPSGPPIVITRPAYINVFASPTANFSSNVRQVCWGTPINFTDNSTAGSGNIVSWLWNFGDGQISTQQNPSHTYASGGIFNVSLQVTDVNGCSDVFRRGTYIRVDKPSAAFSFNNVFGCNPPLNVQFTSTGTTNGTHQWLFGAGSSSQVNPSFTFTNPGVYTITHIVTDPNGCSDTLTLPNLVQVGQTSVQVQASKTRACVGESIQFFCGSSVASNVSWNLGPGGTSSLCNPTVVFPTAGTFTIRLTLTYPNNCTVNGSVSVTIDPKPTIAISTPNNFACTPPLTANFSSAVANAPPGSVYTWNFGDGSTSNATNPSHTYTTAGFFSVQLKVVTPNGCADSVSIPSMVIIGGLNAEFSASPREGCQPLNVAFFNLSSNTLSPITSYAWTFGNGATSNLAQPGNTYNTRGKYTVKLVITNAAGCVDSVIKTNYIAVGDTVVANFTPKDSIYCGWDISRFRDSSIGIVDRWIWDFGDGQASNLPSPVHQYTDTGYFRVTLIVSDNGCKDTLRVDSAVYIKPVIAYVAGSFRGCDTPFVTNFLNLSLGGHVWHWDFGTGNPADTSNALNPVFTYNQTGNYLLQMFAHDTLTGCRDTFENLIQIELIDIWGGVDTTYGCVPHAASFTGGSNYATTQLWTFGDGGVTNQFNVPHTYTRPGIFRPKLSVWNSIGCRLDTTLRVAAYKPVVFFAAQDTNGCEPYAPAWINGTHSLLPVSIWDWDLGDGTFSNVQLPNNAFSQGHFTTKLVVTDTLGCTDSLTRTNYVYVNNPIASFTVDDSVSCIGQPLFFQSTSRGQSLLATNWDFGDNTNSTQPVLTHNYTTNGTYNAGLLVVDSIGCTKVASKQIVIADPAISIGANTTFASCPPLLVNFSGISHSPHNFVRWEWDFGDGNTSIAQNPSNLYTNPGVYTVKLKAISSTGCVDSAVLIDYITVLGPDGTLTFSPLTGCPGTVVSFSVVDSNTVSSVCDLGDGALEQGMPKLINFAHTYTSSGVYKPILILDDGKGCKYPVIPADSIIIYPLPQVAFSANLTSLCESGTVQFNDNTSSIGGIQSWLWKFGDGQTSALQNPSHYYARPDSYQVTLVITTLDGCVDSLVRPAYLIVRDLPKVAMTLSDTAGCQPFNLLLQDNSPSTNAPISTWLWQSGYAGGTSATPNTQFSYPVSGFYIVSLRLTDQFGCTNETDSLIHVLPLPKVDFGVLPDSFGCAPVTLQFADRVRSGTHWRWNFGDGGSSSLQDPMHNYARDGIYDVKLVVTDSRGCMDSLTKAAYIHLNHPKADFTALPLEGCPPLLVNFSDISLSDTSLVNWRWDFGDLATGVGANPQHSYLNPGLYSVQLVVSDAFGCKDSVKKEKLIKVLEDKKPLPPVIRRVTVTSDSDVRIEWEVFVDVNKDFGRYELYREDPNGNWGLVFSTPNRFLTNYLESGLNTQQQSYCYKLVVVNYCENASDLNSSTTHCSILLSTTSLAESIQLDWTPYVGFDVGSYNIYRVQNYSLGSAKLIQTVGPQTFFFVDTDMFCYEEVTYRIEAIKRNEALSSYSNISKNAPIHQAPSVVQDLVRATVEDNERVLIEWQNIALERAKELVLERNDGNGYRTLDRIPLPASNSFRDENVFVALQPYNYRAFLIDSCGDRTAYGLPGSSIHLTAERKQGTVFLDWSSYKGWASGVSDYQIEVYDDAAAAFVIVDRIMGTDTSYQDRRTEIQQGDYCYRIRAFENIGNDTISLSNEACVTIQPQLFAPNAFTPNQDGINEVFLVKGAYLESYNLRIFTRWGYKIFESNDREEGWDGTFQEQDVPEGVYVFVVHGVGLNGRPVHLQGTVTLIR